MNKRSFCKLLMTAGSFELASNFFPKLLLAQEIGSVFSENKLETVSPDGMRAKGVLPMKALLVLVSIHNKNTGKIADIFSRVFNAEIKTPHQVNLEELREYHLIGFGSGIYDQKHHTSMLDLVDRQPQVTGTKAFIFSTSGFPRKFIEKKSKYDPHNVLREKLCSKGYIIVDEFNCAGWNTNGFLKLFGGLNKGKPNTQDLANAEKFARNLIS